MFQKYNIEPNSSNNVAETKDLFKVLAESTNFEDVSSLKGSRQGAVIADIQDNGLVPIVRTTSIYKQPIQKFKQEHYDIIKSIQRITEKELKIATNFNNALIEIYDSRYYSMSYHSDQALDLADDSYICLFSCYSRCPKPLETRKLVIKKKCVEEAAGAAGHEDIIELENNSIVLFSTSTNSKYLHKIVLDKKTSVKDTDIKWLGITFRLSKTLINYSNNTLKIANEEERKEYYRLRSEENKKIDFKYPEINYTISPSDILLPL